MKLYGFGPTRSLRALWGLKELDADFEFVPVNLLAGEHKRPEFLRLNPTGKVPVLVDGDQVIPESAAIVLYLADKYRDKGLLPEGLPERAQAYRWIMFAVTELEQPLWRITRHTALYPEDKRIPADIALGEGGVQRHGNGAGAPSRGTPVHRRRPHHHRGLRDGLFDRLGQRVQTDRRISAAARVSGAHVRAPDGAATYCGCLGGRPGRMTTDRGSKQAR
jgi:Glutathione S-transferase, N-terminal domain